MVQESPKKRGFLNKIVDSGGQKIKKLKERTLEKGKKLSEFYGKATKIVTGKLQVKVEKLQKEIKEGIKEPVKKFFQEKKLQLKKWMCTKVENSVLKLLKIAHPKIKKAIKDPDMWLCVKDLVDDLVDELWPEVQEEIILKLRMKTSKPVVIVPKLGSVTFCS